MHYSSWAPNDSVKKWWGWSISEHFKSVIVWESVPGAKSCGQPIWLKLRTEVGCDEIFWKPIWFTSLTFSFGATGGVSFFAVWEPKVQPSRGHFESAIRPHFSALCSQMNLTMNSTIIELSVYTWNFVLKVLNREEPGAGVWPKLMLKLQPQIAIFQNFRIFTCLLA